MFGILKKKQLKNKMFLAEKLDENVYYYKNVISDPKKFINDLNSIDDDEHVYPAISNWRIWLASNSDDDCFGEKKDLFFENIDKISGPNAELARSLVIELKNSIESLCHLFVSDRELGIVPNISPYLDVCNYHVGGQLGWHCDTQDGDKSLLYSIVIYFNDDHEGGEIEFNIIKPSGMPNKIYLKPEPGSALIFPSTPPYLHKSNEIVSGNKYMSTAFIFVEGYDPNNAEHVKKYRGI